MHAMDTMDVMDVMEVLSVSGAVHVPRSDSFALVSPESGREYRILLACPEEPPPEGGYPVYYFLDGNAVFATAVEAARLLSRRRGEPVVAPAIVVGIGYPTEQVFDPSRFYDFTMPVRPEELSFLPDGRPMPMLGGADAFAMFIKEVLKPAVERRFPIDRSRQTLFGHSLGGLFALRMLFAFPDAFRTYIAGSPSIHWNRRPLRELEKAFAASVRGEPTDVRVLIAAGELEDGHHSGMNGNAREQAGRLAALASYGVRSEYREFAGEDHLSVLPVLISHGLRFASMTS